MHSKTAFVLLAAVICPSLLGCSSSGNGNEPAQVSSSSAALRRTESCEDLTQTLRADASSKMNRRIDAEVRAIQAGYSSYGYGSRYDYASSGPAPGAGLVTAAPTLNSGAQTVTDANAPAHSETETQVKGVDEADIVKADGTRLYVLHGAKVLDRRRLAGA